MVSRGCGRVANAGADRPMASPVARSAPLVWPTASNRRSASAKATSSKPRRCRPLSDAARSTPIASAQACPRAASRSRSAEMRVVRAARSSRAAAHTCWTRTSRPTACRPASVPATTSSPPGVEPVPRPTRGPHRAADRRRIRKASWAALSSSTAPAGTPRAASTRSGSDPGHRVRGAGDPGHLGTHRPDHPHLESRQAQPSGPDECRIVALHGRERPISGRHADPQAIGHPGPVGGHQGNDPGLGVLGVGARHRRHRDHHRRGIGGYHRRGLQRPGEEVEHGLAGGGQSKTIGPDVDRPSSRLELHGALSGHAPMPEATILFLPRPMEECDDAVGRTGRDPPNPGGPHSALARVAAPNRPLRDVARQLVQSLPSGAPAGNAVCPTCDEAEGEARSVIVGPGR